MIPMRRRFLLTAAVALTSGLLMSSDLFLAGQASAAVAPAPAHSLAAAKTHTAIPHNAWQHAALSTQTQTNWYRLSVTSHSYLYAMLGTLPANYNLRLYDATGKQLSASDHTGTTAESIGRTLNPGTYFLRVASTKGFAKRKAYDLMARVAPSSATIGILTAHVGNMGDIVGEMVNVSNEWLEVPAMDVWLYGKSGKLLKKYKYTSSNNLILISMAPGARAPFDISPPESAQSFLPKTTRVKVVPYWYGHAARKPAPVRLSVLKQTTHKRNGLVWVDWSGKATNLSDHRLPHEVMLVEARDQQGILVGLARDGYLGLLVGATKKFTSTYNNWHPNLTFSMVATDTVID
jgi:hypothetical protein